jgi:hypothetical protein
LALLHLQLGTRLNFESLMVDFDWYDAAIDTDKQPRRLQSTTPPTTNRMKTQAKLSYRDQEGGRIPPTDEASMVQGRQSCVVVGVEDFEGEEPASQHR